MNRLATAAAMAVAIAYAGCIHVKTENEIKPIHITMDVNLKVDKDLEKAFSDEQSSKPQGDFKAVRELLDRKVAGIDRKAMLVAREGATDDDRLLVAEVNARRLKRFSDIAKTNSVSMESVQTRHAAKMIERMPAGSGVWYEDASGSWLQK